MKKFFIKYNLEIMTAIFIAIVIVNIFNWNSISFLTQILMGYIILFILHEWEESKFPGGFYELFFDGFNVETKGIESLLHLPVAIYLLIIMILPLILKSIELLMLVPLILALFEGFIHNAGIFIFKKKKPYTPGLVSADIMFVFSIWAIIQLNIQNTFTNSEWIIGIILTIIGFIIMETFFLKTVGLTFKEFRKKAMERVLKRKV